MSAPLTFLLGTTWAAPGVAPTLTAATPVEAYFSPLESARLIPKVLHVIMWSATAGSGLRLRVTPSGPGGARASAHLHEDTAGAGGECYVRIPSPLLRYAIEGEHTDGVTAITDARYVVFIET